MGLLIDYYFENICHNIQHLVSYFIYFYLILALLPSTNFFDMKIIQFFLQNYIQIMAN
jgi:hypothetical protein